MSATHSARGRQTQNTNISNRQQGRRRNALVIGLGLVVIGAITFFILGTNIPAGGTPSRLALAPEARKSSAAAPERGGGSA